jgi:hypothetical protein
MPVLQPPDTIHHQSATGSVGLGDHAAFDELELISAAKRSAQSDACRRAIDSSFASTPARSVTISRPLSNCQPVRAWQISPR